VMVMVMSDSIMRLLQLRNFAGQRRVALVEGERVVLLRDIDSIFSLAQRALATGETLAALVQQLAVEPPIAYDEVYERRGDWRILPAIDHPHEPTRCLVSGTGLTHLKSAENRQTMHAKGGAPTDSMRIYDWGVERGKPPADEIGVSPEWFYKGTGTILRAHGEPLIVPPHADDGGEEAEIAGAYIIDASGTPRRIGMAIGNEFSDHVFEEKNFMYIAASKLMPCAIGPELIIDPDFRSVAGQVTIERNGTVLWRRDIQSGEAAMCHGLANLEHHHFKHPAHRRPGDVHVHFFGVDAFSFGEGVKLEHGDVMQLQFSGFGRPLRNPVQVDKMLRRLFIAAPL
jgi:hypothetical protein